MGDSIGFANFISVEGEPDARGLVLQEITRPGVDDRAFIKLGLRGSIYELTGKVDAVSAFVATALHATYKGYIGSTVNVVIHGQTYYYQAIINVRINEIKQLGNAVGGLTSGTFLVTSTWTLVSLVG